MKKRVVLGMSGGVDSSLAAYLLKKEGYDVIGVTMSLYMGTGNSTEQNIKDAKMVAETMEIPFHVFHMEDVFEKEVIQYFIEEYRQGRTPNPCVVCNRRIKFDYFLEEAKKLGADYISTGHYAKIVYDENTKRYLLKRPKDEEKDQTYFLYRLTQEQLSQTVMPLEDFTKEEVRELSGALQLPVAKKRDSEDVCFIQKNDIHSFLESRLGNHLESGNFVDTKGNELGKHKGIPYYTIGQRRGLGLAMGKRVFVQSINPRKNEVVIAEDSELYSSGLLATDLNFISIPSLTEPIQVKAKIRYSKGFSSATIYPLGEKVLVHFAEKQRAIASGQSVVFYSEDTVVGGGIIKKSLSEEEIKSIKKELL